MSYLDMAKRASVKLGLRQTHHEEKVLFVDGEDPRRPLETVEPELRHDPLEADSRSDDCIARNQAFTLIVNRTAEVTSPVHVHPWLTIVDVEKFIEATLASLRSYVAARNRGQEHHWVERLLDEKLKRLRVCGVQAEIRQIH